MTHDDDKDAARREATRKRLLASDSRSRFVFATIAFLVPATLFGLFRRQELRLRALVDHGQTTVTTVSGTTDGFVDYEYQVNGVIYTWDVMQDKVPARTFPITYLPEDPSLSRPVSAYTAALLEAELSHPADYIGLGAFFSFFAGAAIWAQVRVRRFRRSRQPATKSSTSPEVAGRLIALLMLGIVLATNLNPKVQSVNQALLGHAPFGQPLLVVVVLAQLVLASPLLWVLPHLMRIVMNAQAKGRSVSQLGIVMAVWQAGPEQKLSRAIVLGGVVYFLTLLAAWSIWAQSARSG